MKLLVSVISKDETKTAMVAEADVIDVKNPAEGSLGAQPPPMIREISSIISSDIPCSVTIGDAADKPGTYALAALGAASSGADWIKVGLLGFSEPDPAIHFLKTIQSSLNTTFSKTKLFAVFYADWRDVQALPWNHATDVCRSAGLDGCVLDTYNKNGKDLFFYCAPEEIQQFVSDAKSAGLMTGLAGSIRLDHLETLIAIDPYMVGVRTAICTDSIREQTGISGDKIQQFKKLLQSRPATV